MTVESFTPTLWAASLLKNLNRDHVFKNAFNGDYEGELKMGATLRINSIGRITISDYQKNTDLSAPETLNLADQTFVINQGKTFHFFVDDLDKAQMRSSVREAAMQEASWGIADVVDTFLATTLSTALPAANTLTAATIGNAATDTDAYNTLVQLGVTLTENNVPDTGRKAFVPPWYEGMLRTDPRFVSFGTPGNTGRLRGDPIGETAGFTVYKSNNMPTSGGNPVVLATYQGASTFAEQVQEMNAYRPERRFGDAVKGLHVYGAKTTRPFAVAGIVSTRGTF